MHRLPGWRESSVAGKGTDQAWSCWRQRPAADHSFLHPQVIPDSEGHPRVVPREVCMGIWSRASIWFCWLEEDLSEIMRSPESSQSQDGPQKARAGGLLHPDCAHHAAALQSVPLLPGLMLPIWSAQMHEAPQFLLLEQYNHYCSRYPKSYKHSFKRNGGIIFFFYLMRSSFWVALLVGGVGSGEQPASSHSLLGLLFSPTPHKPLPAGWGRVHRGLQ